MHSPTGGESISQAPQAHLLFLHTFPVGYTYASAVKRSSPPPQEERPLYEKNSNIKSDGGDIHPTVGCTPLLCSPLVRQGGVVF